MPKKRLWTPWRMPYLTGQTRKPDQGCLFCVKPQSKEDAANHILRRGTYCYVILNLYPYNNGHLMVIPYRHTGRLDDLDQATVLEFMTFTQDAIKVLAAAYNPQGFNIGINMGQAAGAGIAEHLHQHIVPRWPGDTNFVSIIGETRVIPEWIDDTYVKLKQVWDELLPSDSA